MPTKPISLLAGLSAALLISVAATAQESGGETPTPANPFPELAMGEEIMGTPFVVSEHEDWALQCIRVPEGEEQPCYIAQVVADTTGNPTAAVNIFTLPDDPNNPAKAAAEFVTPLGTLLTANLVLAIDVTSPKVYPYRWCDQRGCFAQIGLTNEELDMMRAGERAMMTIVSVENPQAPILLPISLKGFTAAYDALKAR